MKVFVDGVERYTWEVSTGLRGYDTPSGTYTARSMNEIWYSKQWDDAPMPHAIFFTKKGHAVHGTTEIKHLGKPASHGCVRLAPENAGILFALVKEKGLENTEIVLSGDAPKTEAKVASAGTRKNEAKHGKKNTKTVRKGRKPAGVRRPQVRASIYAQRLGSLFPVAAARLLPPASWPAVLHARLLTSMRTSNAMSISSVSH
jgi:hypothetical protein